MNVCILAREGVDRFITALREEAEAVVGRHDPVQGHGPVRAVQS